MPESLGSSPAIAILRLVLLMSVLADWCAIRMSQDAAALKAMNAAL